MKDLIGYERIIEDSMRKVIRETLRKVEKTGLPGSHYFVINFFTKARGVEIPKNLLEKYPEEMTIILQNQYRGLSVYERFFKIGLSFSGKFENLTIPFSAVSSFCDPAINFVLKFRLDESDPEYLEEEFVRDIDPSNHANSDSDSEVNLDSKVISLDAFRKKNKPKKPK